MKRDRNRKHPATQPCEAPRTVPRAAHLDGWSSVRPGGMAMGVAGWEKSMHQAAMTASRCAIGPVASRKRWGGGSGSGLSMGYLNARCVYGRPKLRHEQIWSIHLHGGRNAPRQPVLDALLPAVLGKPQQFRHLGWATQRGDDLDVFFERLHAGHCKHSVYQKANHGV